MKKLFILLTILLCCACSNDDTTTYSGNAMTTEISDTLLTSNQEEWPDYEIYNIKEKMFIGQVNDIYLNYSDYKEMYIQYEGVYTTTYGYKLVVRYGPGCCAGDGIVGFQIYFDGEYPENNSWVSIIGILEEYEIDGEATYILRVKEMTVKEDYGNIYVSQ